MKIKMLLFFLTFTPVSATGPVFAPDRQALCRRILLQGEVGHADEFLQTIQKNPIRC